MKTNSNKKAPIITKRNNLVVWSLADIPFIESPLKRKSSKKIKLTPQQQISQLKKQIHVEMRRIAIQRHGYCVTCGKFKDVTLQGGHLISRQKANTRFDLMNVFTQCSGCNMIHERNPEIFTLWFIKNFGIQEYESLIERSKILKSWKKFELIELLENYKQINTFTEN